MEDESIDDPLSFEDVEGQWTLVDIDTIPEKQSLEVNEAYNNRAVEYITNSVELVDGVLKCVEYCPGIYPKEIEFDNDSIFRYTLPTHIRSRSKVSVWNNMLSFKRNNSVWTQIESNISLSMSADRDTLRVGYLENTGLYLSEIYERTVFDEEVSQYLREYSENLPLASGTYELVYFDPFESEYEDLRDHHHTFPHTIPETLNFSEDSLTAIQENDYEVYLLTDGVPRPYGFSWSGGERFWVYPEGWYDGPDSSYLIIYDRIDHEVEPTKKDLQN